MNPTVAAACISGGVGALGIVGTAVTAWIGSRNTRRATEQAIAAGVNNTRATLAAAHEARLWEKRAAAYEENLIGLLHRQARRVHDLRGFRWDEETEKQMESVLDSYDPPGSFEMRGRLVAYASDAAMSAFNVASGAHGEVRGAYAHRDALKESARLAQASGRLEGVPDGDTMMTAHRQLNNALEAAGDADDALIKVLRDELRSKPEAALPPPALPAVRRAFWRRRKAVEG